MNNMKIVLEPRVGLKTNQYVSVGIRINKLNLFPVSENRKLPLFFKTHRDFHVWKNPIFPYWGDNASYHFGKKIEYIPCATEYRWNRFYIESPGYHIQEIRAWKKICEDFIMEELESIIHLPRCIID